MVFVLLELGPRAISSLLTDQSCAFRVFCNAYDVNIWERAENIGGV